VTYNEFRGITGTFRYFLYPNDVERMAVIASYSTKIDREINLSYRNLAVFGGRFHIELQVLDDRDSTIRFFGIGPESKKENESNMTLEQRGVFAIVGVNITPTTRLSLGETLQKYLVDRGSVRGLPFTGDLFPDLPGIQGATIHAQRVALSYDSRDSQTAPSRGLRASVFAEASAGLLGSDADYIKSGAEVIYLHPLVERRIILVARGLAEFLTGDADTPFQVLPMLGGVDSLRGFAENRFYGDGRVLFNAEVRARFLELRLFGVQTEFEVAPFVDVGKVFKSSAQLAGANYEVTPGIGFRGLAPPSVVGHIEVGFSREGPAIYVGLDYPF
jgi:outer membrane protein assembly factor BamA